MHLLSLRQSWKGGGLHPDLWWKEWIGGKTGWEQTGFNLRPGSYPERQFCRYAGICGAKSEEDYIEYDQGAIALGGLSLI